MKLSWPTRLVIGVAATLVLMLIVSAIGSLINKASAYSVCNDTTMASKPCAPITHKQEGRKFHHHKLGNGKGYELSDKVKTKLDRKWAKMSGTARRGDHWWDFPFDAQACIWWGGSVWDCTWRAGVTDGKYLDRDFKHITKVAIGCGGESFIANFTVKLVTGTWTGWVGVAGGTVACGALHVWNKWFP